MSLIFLVSLTLCPAPLTDDPASVEPCQVEVVAYTSSRPMCDEVREVMLKYQNKLSEGEYGYMGCQSGVGDLNLIPFKSNDKTPEKPAKKALTNVKGLFT